MSRFRAVPGGVEVRLLGPEIAILSGLGSMLSAAGVEPNDPARKRLLPEVYPDDKDASRDFRRLAEKERVEARSVDREVFARGLEEAAIGSFVLSADHAASWLRVIGEARVVIAARKGLFDAGLPEGRVEDAEVALVMFLGVVQEELVSEMLVNMEDET